MFFGAAKKPLEIAITGDSLITPHLSPYREPDFLVLRELLQQADVRFSNS